MIDMPKLTRKVGNKTKGQPFPPIKRKLDALRKKVSENPSVDDFCKLWKELFGSSLNKKLAKEYIEIVNKSQPTQKGGNAPLSYEMRLPSGDIHTVPYVQSGFGFANINSVSAGGPKEYLGTSAVPADFTNEFKPMAGGSKKKRMTRSKKRQSGGSVFNSIPGQPFSMSSPPTSAQVFANIAQGRIGIPNSPLPEVNTNLLK
jgi:hypothetical protein